MEKGQFVAIIGASGSGKSTLLHLLGGVDRPDGGKIFVEDVDIATFGEERLAQYRRRKVGLIYQFYNLIPTLSVKKNICLPMLLDNKEPGKERFDDIVRTSARRWRRSPRRCCPRWRSRRCRSRSPRCRNGPPAPEMTQEEFNKKFEAALSAHRQKLQDNDASSYSAEARAWAVARGLVQGGGKLPDGTDHFMWGKGELARGHSQTVLHGGWIAPVAIPARFPPRGAALRVGVVLAGCHQVR